MRISIRNILPRLRTKRTPAEAVAIRKEQVLADINEESIGRPRRLYSTVGLTEQRLRARNQRSWTTSTKGWSNFFGRFTTFRL
jgi:hypothetical protein